MRGKEKGKRRKVGRGARGGGEKWGGGRGETRKWGRRWTRGADGEEEGEDEERRRGGREEEERRGRRKRGEGRGEGRRASSAQLPVSACFVFTAISPFSIPATLHALCWASDHHQDHRDGWSFSKCHLIQSQLGAEK